MAISSVDHDMIEAAGARTIPDALRLIPGIVVGHSVNDFGDKPLLVVAYHGHSDQFSRQMNVLIDGRSIYDPLLGGVNWYNIPVSIDDIERIEVTRGPNASTYGSNSFQAVINIITRHASEDQGHYAKVNVGNHDIFDATYRYGGNSGDLDYRITLATVNDDGQDRADGNDAIDDVSSGLIDYRLDYQINPKNQLTYSGSFGRTNQHAEQSPRDNFKPERVVKDTNAHQYLRWDSTVDNIQSFVVKYYFNFLEETDDFLTRVIDIPPIDPFQVPIMASFANQRHNLEFTHYIDPTTSLDLVWGVNTQYEHVDSDYFLFTNGTANRTTLRLYGNAVWDINRHNTIDLGLLLEKSEGRDTDASPRIAYLYHFNDRHTVRVGASQAIRTPFIFEQYGDTTHTHDATIGGTPFITLVDKVLVPVNDLESEKITTYELGYHGKFLNKRMLINTRIFQDRLEDLIDGPEVPDPTGEDNVDFAAFVFDNLYNTRVRGIEAELDYSTPSRAFRLVASGAILDITSEDEVRSGKSREYEESAPDHSFSLLAMNDFNEKYSASVSFYYVGDMAWMDANHNNTCEGGVNALSGCGFRNTQGYRKLDLRIVRNFNVGNESASIALNLQNLLEDYSDYDKFPSSGFPAVEQNLVAFIELKLRVH
ncbi:MAG: TonB-dependent receptor [Thiotrichales bacterium]|nr:MAG: TonB-dependent receptor [Thiotrichales bacterium]